VCEREKQTHQAARSVIAATMFSANENLQLRQAKKQVVKLVEETISEEALDLGTNVMVMQVSCRQPGCVPIETAIVVVFPKSNTELVPGLPESANGGSYKTKILKPLADVTKEDVLDALPPAFEGGLRTTERLCMQARDVMFAQITQIFGGGGNLIDGEAGDTNADQGDDDVVGRRLMAEYLQRSLQEYIERGCVPPKWGEPFPDQNADVNAPNDNDEDQDCIAAETEKQQQQDDVATDNADQNTASAASRNNNLSAFTGTGNLVIRRPTSAEDTDGKEGDATTNKSGSASTAASPSIQSGGNNSSASSSSQSQLPAVSLPDPRPSDFDSTVRRRQQQAADRALLLGSGGAGSNSSSASILSRLSAREHAPGVRRPGCPCCDPDNPSNVVDQMMLL